MAVDVMLATSSRIGEALGLRRRDIDLDSNPLTVHICGTIVYPKKGTPYRQETPKTDKSRRRVALPSWAAQSLAERLAKTPCDPEALVFLSRNGTPLRDCNVRRFLRRVMDANEMERVNPHKSRRTAATHVACEADVELASKLLGHANTAITIQHYIEPTEDVDHATATILESLGGSDFAAAGTGRHQT